MILTTNVNILYLLVQHIPSFFGYEHHSKKGTVSFCGGESIRDIFLIFTFFFLSFCNYYIIVLVKASAISAHTDVTRIANGLLER